MINTLGGGGGDSHVRAETGGGDLSKIKELVQDIKDLKPISEKIIKREANK